MCDEFPYVPEGMQFILKENPWGACSGQGTCNETAAAATELCECNDGWTGRSDFINTDGQDCSTNALALRILWAVYIFWCLFNMVLVRKEVWAKWLQHKEIAEQRDLAGRKKFKITENRGLMAVLLFTFLCAPASMLFGAIMIADPDQRVGLDWPVSILFALSKFGLYGTAWYFQPALMQTILKGQKNTARLVRFSDTYGFYSMILSGTLGLLPVIILVDPSQETAQKVYIAYFGGSVLSMLSFALQAKYIKVRVVASLNKSYDLSKSSKILDIKKRLVDFQNGIIRQGLLQVIFYSAFLFLPFLWNKHQYFLPISWLAMPALYKVLARSTVTSKKVGDSATAGSSSAGSKSDDEPGSKSFSQYQDPASSVAPSTQAVTSFANVDQFKESAKSFVENTDFADGDESDDDGYV